MWPLRSVLYNQSSLLRYFGALRCYCGACSWVTAIYAWVPALEEIKDALRCDGVCRRIADQETMVCLASGEQKVPRALYG